MAREIPITSDEWDEAFEQGKVAARQGRRLYDCPYRNSSRESALRRAWREGFLEGAVEDDVSQKW